jgi:DNA-binding transcriptional ArsR family regulator
MKCPSYDLFFETISNKVRIRILQLLQKRPMPVNEICQYLGEEQSKVSHNLKRLTDCHLVEAERKGKQKIYSLNTETMLPLMKLVEEHVKKYCCESCGSSAKTKAIINLNEGAMVQNAE